MPPLRRQTNLAIVTGLFLSAVAARGYAQPPGFEDLPYRTATRPVSPQQQNPWPNFGALLDARQPHRPHPAVARIIVPEGPATAYGTGTLIDARDGFGLVITNWHVVRDATGVIDVVFPTGFRSQARALKVDQDWDLAALVIWEPPIEPVEVAKIAPRPGDVLTIHGYGQGDYRVARGRCTQYYAPRVDFPQEMVELDVEARQGDSGGPIFNERGELAGVLFGAGQGTTIGSFAGRVDSFLATLAPDIGRNRTIASVGCVAQDSTHPTDGSGRNESIDLSTDTAVASSGWPHSPWTAGQESRPVATQSPWQDAADGEGSLTDASIDTVADAESQPRVRSALLERAKALLAIIGLFAVCVQIVRVVT